MLFVDVVGAWQRFGQNNLPDDPGWPCKLRNHHRRGFHQRKVSESPVLCTFRCSALGLCFRRDSITMYKKLVGFVPQEDVMIRQLSVEQILLHSARTRLPSSLSEAE